MKEIKVTVTTVHDLLRKAVELKGGNYVYPTYKGTALGCYYAKDGQPDCIVGHVLFDLGVPIEDMSDNTEGVAGRVSAGIIGIHRDYLHSRYGLDFDNVAWEMLCSAQCVQDNRDTWGEALKSAEDIMAYLNEYESE